MQNRPGPEHLLSLCLIVRVAETTIGAALASVRDLADELVVVDTGSVDGTRAVAAQYGARVVDFPWIDDFSAARNAALDAAGSEWILILDSDETLDAVDPAELRVLLADPEAMAYYLRIREVGAQGPGDEYRMVRLFRNRPEARYRFPVHEQIVPSLLALAEREGRRFKTSDLGISHTGTPGRIAQGKGERNRRLLRAAIDGDPDNPYFHFQLAREFAVYLADEVMPIAGFLQLVAEVERAVDLMDRMPRAETVDSGYGPEMYSLLGNARLSQGRPEEALAVCEHAIDRFGEPSTLRFFHGRALLALAATGAAAAGGMRRRGIERLQRLQHDDAGFELAPVSSRHRTLYSLRYLGLAAVDEARFDEAETLFEQALRIDPHYTGALCGLALLADRRGRAAEAMRLYLGALKINEAEWSAWRGGADLLQRMGRDEDARQWLGKLPLIFPDLR